MVSECKDHSACPSVALSMEQIKEAAKLVSKDWHYQLASAPYKMSREFNFANYQTGVDFACKVAQVAEELNHHPDIYLGYKTVSVTYWTHNANGLTHMDFAATVKIDQLNFKQ